MEIRNISNLTEATQVDGIYIFSVPPPGYVRGVGTGVVGIVGDFELGPVDEVLSIGSTGEFTEILGGYGTAPSGSESTWKGYSGFRAVAGKQWPAGLRIVRPGRDGQAKATIDIDLTTAVSPATGRKITITEKSHGAAGNATRVTIETATDASLTAGFRLTIRNGNRVEVIDNLFAAMTSDQLAERAKVLRFWDLAISNETPSTKGAWPLTVSLAGGDDGDPLSAKWTGAIDKLLARKEVNIIFCAEPDGTVVTPAALNAYLKSKIAPSTGGSPIVIAVLFGEAGQDIDEAALDVADYRSPRLIYTWPYRKQYFPQAVTYNPNGLLLVPSADVVAAALAAIDPVYDPSCIFGTNIINAATVGLEFDDLNRDDYVTANRNGICALERDSDVGYRIRSGITTSLVNGQEMINRQRLEDFFNVSIATSLKQYQGLPMTEAWKDDVKGIIADFYENQKKVTPDARVLAYELDTATVNTPSTLGQGLFQIKQRVQTPASARFIVLLSEVGPTVTVTAQQ